jgi:hypothetical protein
MKVTKLDREGRGLETELWIWKIVHRVVFYSLLYLFMFHHACSMLKWEMKLDDIIWKLPHMEC